MELQTITYASAEFVENQAISIEGPLLDWASPQEPEEVHSKFSTLIFWLLCSAFVAKRGAEKRGGSMSLILIMPYKAEPRYK